MEIWVDINGYEGYYQISTFGNVRSVDRLVRHSRGGMRKLKGKIIKTYPSPTSGYLVAHLRKEGVRSAKSVHRLVALAFVDNPHNMPEVNHKSGNKLDNHDTNL